MRKLSTAASTAILPKLPIVGSMGSQGCLLHLLFPNCESCILEITRRTARIEKRTYEIPFSSIYRRDGPKAPSIRSTVKIGFYKRVDLEFRAIPSVNWRKWNFIYTFSNSSCRSVWLFLICNFCNSEIIGALSSLECQCCPQFTEGMALNWELHFHQKFTKSR